MSSERKVREVESKWRIGSTEDVDTLVRALEEAGARVSEPSILVVRDRYLETSDRFFHAAEARCRLRSENGRFELNLKGTGTPNGAVHGRIEQTVELPDASTEQEALDRVHAEVLESVLGGRRLDLLFAIENRRIRREVHLADGSVAELCVDDASAFANGRAVPLREVELELLRGDEEIFGRLVATLTKKLGLEPEDASKFDRSVRGLGLSLPSVSVPRVAYAPSDRLAEVARQWIHRQLAILRKNEPGVRVGLAEEAIHDMRVAARRTRSALRAFREVLPDAAPSLEKEARWLGRALGQGRDLEVQIEYLFGRAAELDAAHREALEPYRALLMERQRTEAGEIVSALNDERYRRLLDSLQALVLSVPSERQGKKSARKGGRKVLKRALERLLDRYPRHLDEDVADAKLHELRKELKRVRYTAEFLEPIADSGVADFVRRTKKLQEVLGDHQDASTGLAMVREDAGEAAAGSPSAAAVSAAMDRLAERVGADKASLRRDFLEAWPRYRKRKRLEALPKEL